MSKTKQKDLEGNVISDYTELLVQCNEAKKEFDKLTKKYECESLIFIKQIDVLEKEIKSIRQKFIGM